MSQKRPNPGVLMMPRKITGHDPNVVHSFNHTDGQCPKCASKQGLVVFCQPGQSELPRVSGCEVDGEHLHKQCASCGYPWCERTFDQLLQSQAEGWMIAESQIMAALACVAKEIGGIRMEDAKANSYRGWTIRFTRESDGMFTITAEPTPETGQPAHPEMRGQVPGGRGM